MANVQSFANNMASYDDVIPRPHNFQDKDKMTQIGTPTRTHYQEATSTRRIHGGLNDIAATGTHAVPMEEHSQHGSTQKDPEFARG